MDAHLPASATPQLNLDALNVEANLATNHPKLMATWTAASDTTITETVINGTTISNPAVVTQSPWAKVGDAEETSTIDVTAIHPPPAGFVLSGQIKLFGSNKDATIYSYHAPTPPNIQLDPNVSPIFQIVMLDSMKLSDFIPAIVNTPFDVLNFTNVTVTHQNYPFDIDKFVGWSLDADLLISKETGMLYDFFHTTLGMAAPKVTFRMAMCTSECANWTSSLDCTSFTLEGILPGVTFKPCGGLQFTSIGVRILASYVHQPRGVPETKPTSQYGFEVFGSILLDVPGSVVPLDLDWVASKSDDAMQLSATVTGNIWDDAFGVKGLKLSALELSAILTVQAPLSTFSFNVDAALVAGSTTLNFFGSIAPGSCLLSASVNNLGRIGISEIFEHLTGDTLHPPELYLRIGAATATLSTSGLSILVHDLEFEDYASVDALLSISSTGVIVQGEVTNVVTFDEITIEKAYVQVRFGGSSSKSGTSVIIGGTVKIESLVVDVGVHLYDSGPETDELDYTIFGSIGPLRLSALSSELSGGLFEEMTLQSAALIVASQPDADLSMFIGGPFTIQKGVQICANVGSMASLDKLMGSPQSGLELNAGWSSALGFRFDLYVPGAHGIPLGKGLTTEPFKLEIQTKPPTLQLTAGLKVAVPKQDPLEFSLAMSIDELGARGVAQMVGYWVDPLGISDQVKIGPNLALSIEIIFAEGLPGGLGFAGGLQIGKASAQIAVNISEDPMHELIYTEVQALDLADVVDFASQITKIPMAMGPNIIDFQDVKLYICPTGMNIGAVIYPQGVSYAATCIIFGKKGDISVAFGGGGIKMSAGLDNFVLGPLSIRGTSGPRALLDIEVTTAKQHIYADVVARLFDLDITFHMNFDGMPKPTFSLDFMLHLTPLLTFEVDAQMLGDFKDLSSLDFSLTALFEQHLVAYVAQEVQAQLDSARKSADKGFATAENLLVSAQKDADKQINKVTADVTKAYNQWQVKAAAVHASSQKAIDDYMAKLKQLQDKVANAKAAMDKAVQKASDDLTRANSDRASKMAGAQKTLADAQSTWTQKIKDAQAKLDQANANMSRDFGNAQLKIDGAQSNVNKIQNDINDMNQKISNYKHAHWYEVHKKVAIPGLYIALGVLEGSMKAATAVLDAAKGVSTGSAYLGSKVAIAAASGILSTTQTAGAGAIASAKTSLSGIDTATAVAISHATAAVRDVAQGAEVLAFKAANDALAAFNTANKDVLKFAQAAIDELIQSTEYIAYQSALNALAAAKHATTSLDGLKIVLQGVSAAEDASLKAAEYVVTQGAQAMDIRTIALSATLTGISGGSGTFSAQVAGLLVGQSFNIHTELDIRRPAEFITSIFNQLWEKLKDLPDDILHTSNPSRPDVVRSMPIYLHGAASANRPTIVTISDLTGTDANTFTLANNFHRDAAHSVVVVYGGKLITTPDVIAKVTTAITSQQDYIVQSGNLGGDPAPGVLKSCAVVYEANGFVCGRFTWEGSPLSFSLDINTITYGFGTSLAKISQPIFNSVSTAFFSATSLQVTNELFGGSDPAPGHVKSCTIDYTSYGTRKRRTVNEKAWFNFGKDIAYIEYGGHKITDAAIYEKVFAAMDTTSSFLVNNVTLGGDPTPGQPKTCVVHIQQGGAARVVSAAEDAQITIW